MSPTQPTAAASPKVQELLEAPLSLRERKKLKTRQTIRREAYRLISDQGYEQTTVDQIAAAAEVSPSTFFRYFATKEDLVLSDEYDPAMAAALLTRPSEEPFLRACREVVVGMLREVFAEEREELLTRLRLVRDVPALRSRLHESTSEPQRLLLDVLARRAGVERPTLQMRVTAAAVAAAITETVLYWADSEGTEDITALMEQVFTTMEHGFG
jgi:AcrR family transcriptional regulator